jgi:hypothetical protein
MERFDLLGKATKGIESLTFVNIRIGADLNPEYSND